MSEAGKELKIETTSRIYSGDFLEENIKIIRYTDDDTIYPHLFTNVPLPE